MEESDVVQWFNSTSAHQFNKKWMMPLYSVSTSYACAGVVVEDGVVVEAAPIFRWMIGKQWSEAKKFKKITNVTKVETFSEDED